MVCQNFFFSIYILLSTKRPVVNLHSVIFLSHCNMLICTMEYRTVRRGFVIHSNTSEHLRYFRLRFFYYSYYLTQCISALFVLFPLFSCVFINAPITARKPIKPAHIAAHILCIKVYIQNVFIYDSRSLLEKVFVHVSNVDYMFKSFYDYKVLEFSTQLFV